MESLEIRSIRHRSSMTKLLERQRPQTNRRETAQSPEIVPNEDSCQLHNMVGASQFHSVNPNLLPHKSSWESCRKRVHAAPKEGPSHSIQDAIHQSSLTGGNRLPTD